MSSIHDVARRASVSPATVSRSFRNPELLSEETLSRVAQAARELDYRPRVSRAAGESVENAENLGTEEKSGGVHDAIGFQFFSPTAADREQLNAFYAPMLMGAQQEAALCGLNLLIHNTDRQTLTRELPRMVSQRSIDGLLLVGSSNSADFLPALSEYVPHIVLLDDFDANSRFESVVSDGFGGMYKATQFLLQSGHRKIAFFLAESEIRVYQDRMHGYVSALLDEGITPDPRLILGHRLEDSFESRESRLTNLLSGADRPSALLVANDDYALYIMRIMRRMGLRTPQDISIIGFDNAMLGLHSDPPLTTVEVDKDAMGRLAAQRLISRIRSPAQSVQFPVVNKVSTNLVIRQSCRNL